MMRLYLLLLVLSGCAMLCSGFLVSFIGSSDKGLSCETLTMIKLQTLLTVGKYFSMENMLIFAEVLCFPSLRHATLLPIRCSTLCRTD